MDDHRFGSVYKDYEKAVSKYMSERGGNGGNSVTLNTTNMRRLIAEEDSSMVDDIVEETKVKIPVAVMGNILLLAARGFRYEDPHNMVEMNSEEFEFFSRLMMRSTISEVDPLKIDWVKGELESFWKEFEPKDESHDIDPVSNQPA